MATSDIVRAIGERQKVLGDAISKGDGGRSALALANYSWKLSDNGLALASRNAFNSQAGDVDEVHKAITYTISDGAIDRDGDTVDPQGAYLENYRHEPIVMFGHGLWDLPIGKSMSPDGRLCVWPEENRVRATCWFDDHDPDACFLFDKSSRGFLNTTSIAFTPIKAWRRDQQEKANSRESAMAAPGWHFSVWDLTEWSLTPVPANPHAFRDMIEGEKSFVSPKLYKAMHVPFVSKGQWRGWCPCPEGGDCVPCQPIKQTAKQVKSAKESSMPAKKSVPVSKLGKKTAKAGQHPGDDYDETRNYASGHDRGTQEAQAEKRRTGTVKPMSGKAGQDAYAEGYERGWNEVAGKKSAKSCTVCKSGKPCAKCKSGNSVHKNEILNVAASIIGTLVGMGIAATVAAAAKDGISLLFKNKRDADKAKQTLASDGFSVQTQGDQKLKVEPKKSFANFTHAKVAKKPRVMQGSDLMGGGWWIGDDSSSSTKIGPFSSKEEAENHMRNMNPMKSKKKKGIPQADMEHAAPMIESTSKEADADCVSRKIEELVNKDGMKPGDPQTAALAYSFCRGGKAFGPKVIENIGNGEKALLLGRGKEFVRLVIDSDGSVESLTKTLAVTQAKARKALGFGKSAKAMDESSGAAGGYTVPPDEKEEEGEEEKAVGSDDEKVEKAPIDFNYPFKPGDKVWLPIGRGAGVVTGISFDGRSAVVESLEHGDKGEYRFDMLKPRKSAKKGFDPTINAAESPSAATDEGVAIEDDSESDNESVNPDAALHGAQVLANSVQHVEALKSYLNGELPKMDNPGLKEKLTDHLGELDSLSGKYKDMFGEHYPEKDITEMIETDADQGEDLPLEGEAGLVADEHEADMGEGHDDNEAEETDEDFGAPFEAAAAEQEDEVEDGEVPEDMGELENASTQEILDRYKRAKSDNHDMGQKIHVQRGPGDKWTAWVETPGVPQSSGYVGNTKEDAIRLLRRDKDRLPANTPIIVRSSNSSTRKSMGDIDMPPMADKHCKCVKDASDFLKEAADDVQVSKMMKAAMSHHANELEDVHKAMTSDPMAGKPMKAEEQPMDEELSAQDMKMLAKRLESMDSRLFKIFGTRN